MNGTHISPTPPEAFADLIRNCELGTGCNIRHTHRETDEGHSYKIEARGTFSQTHALFKSTRHFIKWSFDQ